jgi:hypothetical protein
VVACPGAVRRPESHEQEKPSWERIPKGKINKTRNEQRLTFNLLLLRLESLAPALDRLLQADDRAPLLREGPALVLVRDAEHDQLPVELRDVILLLLEGRPRPLERSALLLELPQRLLTRQALPLERSPGLDVGGPLLLELTLSLLASGALLPELLLRCDDRGGLVGEAGLQLLGLPGPLLGLALPGPRFL